MWTAKEIKEHMYDQMLAYESQCFDLAMKVENIEDTSKIANAIERTKLCKEFDETIVRLNLMIELYTQFWGDEDV